MALLKRIMYCSNLSIVFVIYFLQVASFSDVSAHIGEPCRLLVLGFCFSSNSYCDQAGICRCKPEFPVNVSPHNCRKARQYGEKCSYSEECTYYDPNSYCTQLPYRSTCECHDEFRYDRAQKMCARISDQSDGPNMLLPTAVGVSLAMSTILCCCLAAWHVCRKRSNGLWTQSCSRFVRSRANSIPNTQSGSGDDCPGVLLQAQDPLPTYEVAVSLQSQDDDQNSADELPPSYDDVMHFSLKEESKTI